MGDAAAATAEALHRPPIASSAAMAAGAAAAALHRPSTTPFAAAAAATVTNGINTDLIRSYLASKLQFSHSKLADVSSDRINTVLQLLGMRKREDDGCFGMAADGGFFRRKIDLVAKLPDDAVHAIVRRFAGLEEPVDVVANAVAWLSAEQTRKGKRARASSTDSSSGGSDSEESASDSEVESTGMRPPGGAACQVTGDCLQQ